MVIIIEPNKRYSRQPEYAAKNVQNEIKKKKYCAYLMPVF